MADEINHNFLLIKKSIENLNALLGTTPSGGAFSFAASGGGGSSTGIRIGDPILSGTPNRILYEDNSNKLAESANLQFDGTDLTVGSKIQFDDTGTYIHQSSDGVLDFVSDTTARVMIGASAELTINAAASTFLHTVKTTTADTGFASYNATNNYISMYQSASAAYIDVGPNSDGTDLVCRIGDGGSLKNWMTVDQETQYVAIAQNLTVDHGIDAWPLDATGSAYPWKDYYGIMCISNVDAQPARAVIYHINGTTAAKAYLDIITVTGDGDPYVRWSISTGTPADDIKFVMGIDNSAADMLTLSYGDDLGTTNVFSVDVDQLMTITKAPIIAALTASTVIYSNASKQITSLATSDGYLKSTSGVFSWAGSAITIGDAINSGTANRMLYEDASNQLAESDSLVFDGTDFFFKADMKVYLDG